MSESSGVVLTPSQETGLQFLANSTENIFLTGGPGTGKSFLITEFLRRMPVKIPVVASTGAAAILIGGRTFHSFFNLGIMQGSEENIIERAVSNGRLKKRIKETWTLVIDEISMLSAEALDCAEKISRIARDCDEPWGGMRIVAVGDFAQLPPITRARVKSWCFQSTAWKIARFRMITLNEVKRTEDQAFLKILESIRWGKLTSEVEDFLNRRVICDEEVELNTPHVFPRRAETEAFNRAKLGELSTPLKTYETHYGGEQKYVERLMSDAPIPPVLEVKRGALVMIRMNDPKQRFVNGTLGTVKDLGEEILRIDVNNRTFDIEPFTFTMLNGDGDEVAFARNFPVTLAYANTIHKMQGTTLERIHVSLKQLWEPGQAYVALSRARSGQGISLMGWDAHSIQADPVVKKFYEAAGGIIEEAEELSAEEDRDPSLIDIDGIIR